MYHENKITWSESAFKFITSVDASLVTGRHKQLLNSTQKELNEIYIEPVRMYYTRDLEHLSSVTRYITHESESLYKKLHFYVYKYKLNPKPFGDSPFMQICSRLQPEILDNVLQQFIRSIFGNIKTKK